MQAQSSQNPSLQPLKKMTMSQQQASININQPFTFHNLISKFVSLGIVGAGSYGEVHKVKHKQTQKIYAVKIYKNVFANRILALRTLREITILRRINNQRIIKIFDVIRPIPEDNNILAVVLQYLPYDLKKLCQKFTTLEDEHIVKIIYQLLIGLKYLRKMNILHRDLKPENILTDKQFNIKICDFGLARPMPSEEKTFTELSEKTVSSNSGTPLSGLQQQKSNSKKFLTCHVVSRWYRAPELILMQQNYDCSIEVWSVGCILGQLIAEHKKNKKHIGGLLQKRKPLFEGKACFPLSPPKKDPGSENNSYKLHNGFPFSEDDQISKILQFIGSPNEEQYSYIEQPTVIKYLNAFPKYEKKQVHQLFNYCKQQWEDFMNKCLVFDPRKRMKIEEALEHPMFDSIRNNQQYKRIEEQKVLDLHLPSDMSIEAIKEAILEQIKAYENGFVMSDS